MPEKVLVVDDEHDIADLLEVYLQNENYIVYKFYSAREALDCIENQEVDLAILDIMLPDVNGFSICQKIREKYTYPIIMLTAKDEETDKITGLTLGADDYITKPFMPKELIFRLNAVLRRCYKEDSPLIELRDCKIDLANAQVIWEDKILPLTAKEHDILEALVRNANHIVTIDALCEAVWGDNPFGYGNSLLAHIRRIREKIEITTSKPKSLITVKGLGYKINVESRL